MCGRDRFVEHILSYTESVNTVTEETAEGKFREELL